MPLGTDLPTSHVDGDTGHTAGHNATNTRVNEACTAVNALATIATTGSASNLASGTVPTARLGSGTASSATFLRGDQTWATPSGSGTVVFSGDNTGATNVSATLVTQATTAAAAGCPLIVPPGTYLISSTAALPAALTLWAPSGATFTGAVAAAGLVTVGSNTEIIGITFDNTSEPDGCSATIQASAKNIIFDRCTIIAPSIGIHANQTGIENLTVRSCRIQDTYFGVLTNSGANDIKGVLVEGCHFTNILGDAIEFNHPSGSAPTCRGFRVVGNNIAGANTTGGTTSTGFGVGAAGVADLTISGNAIWGVLREGIHVEDGSASIVVTGNTIRSIPNSGTNNGGIWVYGAGTDDITISGNTVTDVNGVGICSVYSGGADLVSNVVISNNVVRGCTSHGIDCGANGTAGEGYSVSDNVIVDCDYGIVLRGTFRWGTVQGNLIDSCDVGIGAGQFGETRAVRDNIITNWTTGDYDGFGAYGGILHLPGRTARPSATATTTTMSLPTFRLGQRAEGTLALALRDSGGRVVNSLWQVKWDGTTLSCSRISASNTTADDTNLTIVNGVLNVSLSGVANTVTMYGAAQFEGLIIEDSSSMSGINATGTAYTTGINTQTGTSYTFVLADACQVVRANNASAQTYTIPPNSSVAYPVGTTLEVMRYGAGTLALVGGSGVTVRNPSSATARAQYSTVSALQVAANEWVLAGDLT